MSEIFSKQYFVCDCGENQFKTLIYLFNTAFVNIYNNFISASYEQVFID